MARSKRGRRGRVGKVSFYSHHGAWWLYYREGGRPVRRKVAESRDDAEKLAAKINAQLAEASPTLLSFQPASVSEARRAFLDYHENVLNSSLGTLGRYRSATGYLETFAKKGSRELQVDQVRPDEFVAFLRGLEVAPNGHPNAAKQKLRGKGIRFILETCRALFTFAGKRRHLPPYAGNPFAELPIDRMKVEDAKPIFVFNAESELAFLTKADDWAFPIHFFLAKTGTRIGEAVHLLIEDLDLDAGWLRVVNKPALGWRVKTGNERVVPLLPEVVAVLRGVLKERRMGLVFLRHRFVDGDVPSLAGDRRTLEDACRERQRAETAPVSRARSAAIARGIWRDAGAVKADVIRNSFIRVMTSLGRSDSTCPKSWRHTFATLLQDGNVDPLIRQLVLGHKPTSGAGLGMTANYTHTRPETMRSQVEQALRLWPVSLKFALERSQGGDS